VVLGLGVLVALEGLLWSLDLGEERVYDPFSGFSNLVPMFELETRDDGTAVYRTASARRAVDRQEFLAEKPPNGFRAFVVGGSSAAGFPYKYSHSFAGWLQRRLAVELPQRHVEVVNAALSGYASRRLLAVTEELAGYEPDLLIIYSGHNEFAEARYYQHLIDMDPRWFRLRVFLTSTRLYSVASQAFGLGSPGSPESVEFDDFRSGQEMFAVADRRQRGKENASERELAYREIHYRHNLEGMIANLHGVGAEVMILTLSQNFADWRPGVSFHRDGLAEAERAAWDEHVARGDALAPEDCEAALDAWSRALAIDDEFAELHYQIADCQRSLGHLEEARSHFRLASDLDRIPHGAPTRYNEVLRDLAREQDTLFLDVEALIALESDGSLVGANWFLDLAHPSLRAHRRIARAIADELYANNTPVPQDAWRRGAYTEVELERLYAEDPELRIAEHQARALACLLARHRACVRSESNAVLALDPEVEWAKRFLVLSEQLPDR
jgi:hypothetical protein